MRPRLRIPLWAALLVPSAAYVVRSVIVRGGDFTVDIPGDIVAFVVLLAAVLAAAWVRRAYAETPEDVSVTDPTTPRDVPDSEAIDQTPERS
jgi:hypothetical protein